MQVRRSPDQPGERTNQTLAVALPHANELDGFLTGIELSVPVLRSNTAHTVGLVRRRSRRSSISQTPATLGILADGNYGRFLPTSCCRHGS